MTKTSGPFEVSRSASSPRLDTRRSVRTSRENTEKLIANGSVRLAMNPSLGGTHSPLDEDELEPPERHYDCQNYETCLSLAAALDWKSFQCSNCDETVNQQLLWRAQKKIKDNPALAKFCALPLPQTSPEKEES